MFAVICTVLIRSMSRKNLSYKWRWVSYDCIFMVVPKILCFRMFILLLALSIWYKARNCRFMHTSSRNCVLIGIFLDNRFGWCLVVTIPFMGNILCVNVRKQIAMLTCNFSRYFHFTAYENRRFFENVSLKLPDIINRTDCDSWQLYCVLLTSESKEAFQNIFKTVINLQKAFFVFS